MRFYKGDIVTHHIYKHTKMIVSHEHEGNFYCRELKDGRVSILGGNAIRLHRRPLINWIKSLIPHKHKFQIRGRNQYGVATYQICLKCRKTFERVNNSYEPEKWQECAPIPELDAQFDQNDNYIFKHQ